MPLRGCCNSRVPSVALTVCPAARSPGPPAPCRVSSGQMQTAAARRLNRREASPKQKMTLERLLMVVDRIDRHLEATFTLRERSGGLCHAEETGPRCSRSSAPQPGAPPHKSPHGKRIPVDEVVVLQPFPVSDLPRREGEDERQSQRARRGAHRLCLTPEVLRLPRWADKHRLPTQPRAPAAHEGFLGFLTKGTARVAAFLFL